MMKRLYKLAAVAAILFAAAGVQTAWAQTQIEITLSHTINSDGHVVLNWTPATTVTHVERCTGAGCNPTSKPFLDTDSSTTESSWTDRDVVAGGTYRYRVNGLSDRTVSNILTVTVASPPGRPTAPLATANAHNRVTVTWRAPTNTGGAAITGYTLTRDPAFTAAAPSFDAATTTVRPGNVQTYADTSVIGGMTYTYSVAAMNSSGGGATATTAAVTTPFEFQLTLTRTDGPQTGQTDLRFEPYPANHRLYRSVNGGRFDPSSEPNNRNNQAVILRTTATNVHHAYRLHNADGRLVSNTVEICLGACTRPHPPPPITAGEITSSSITVNWEPSPFPGDGQTIRLYRLEARTHDPNGPWAQIANVAATEPLTYRHAGLTHNTQYRYRVRARNSLPAEDDNRFSDYSQAIPATFRTAPIAPAAPGRPDATLNAAHHIVVTWAAPDDNGAAITGYTLTRNPPFTPNAAVTVGPEMLSYTDMTAIGGRAHTYTIAATNSVGPGAASLPSAAVTPAVNPVTFLSATASSITVRIDGTVTTVRINVKERSAGACSDSQGYVTARERFPTQDVFTLNSYRSAALASNTGYCIAVAGQEAHALEARTTDTQPHSAALELTGGVEQFTAKVTFTNPGAFAVPVNLWLGERDGAACPPPNADGNLPGAFIAHQWTTEPSATDTVTITHPGTSTSELSLDITEPLTAGFYCAQIISNAATSAQGKSEIMQVEVTDPVPPPARPGQPTATVNAHNRITVTWGAPDDNGAAITSYTLTRTPAFANPVTVTGSPPETTYTDNTVTGDNSYTYTVTATNAGGDSDASPASASVTTPGATLSADTTTPGTIIFTFSFTTSSRNVSDIFLLRANAGSRETVGGDIVLGRAGRAVLTNSGTFVATTNPSFPYTSETTGRPADTRDFATKSLTFTYSGGPAGTAFDYQLYGGNRNRVSNIVRATIDSPAHSAELELTDGEEQFTAEVTFTNPEYFMLPVNLWLRTVATGGGCPQTGGNLSSANIAHQWTAEPPATDTVTITHLGNSNSAFEQGEALTAGFYCAQIISAATTSAHGKSAIMQVGVTTRPDAPDAPTFVDVQQDAVTVVWQAPAANGRPITHYLVRRLRGGTLEETFTVDASAGLRYTDSGLRPGSIYFYTVAARNGVGDGPASDAGQTQTSDATARLRHAFAANGHVTLTWEYLAAVEDIYESLSIFPTDSLQTHYSTRDLTEREWVHTQAPAPGARVSYMLRLASASEADPLDSNVIVLPALTLSAADATAAATLEFEWGVHGAPEFPAQLRAHQLTNAGDDCPDNFPGNTQILATYTAASEAGAHTVSSGVTGGATYCLRLTAADTPFAIHSPVVKAQAPAAPDAPGRPTATANAHNRVTVTWGAPDDNGAGITRYTLTRDPEFDAPVTVTGSPPDPRYVDNSVERGNSYTYTVTATNSAGTGAASPASASVTTPDLPDAPGQPEATAAAAGTSVTVTWDMPEDNGAGIIRYTLTRDPDFTPNAAVTVTGSPLDTRYVDNSVTRGNSYTYTVMATNSVGDSPVSPDSDSVTTPDRPDQPGQPTANPTAHNRVTITWDLPDDNGAPITGYTLTRDPAFDAAVTVGPSPRSYVDTTATGGNSYTYTVTATNAAGDSDASPDSASVSTPPTPVVPEAPATPGPPEATATAHNSVTVTWDAPNNNGADIIRYTLTRNPAFPSNAPMFHAGSSTVRLTGTPPDTTYTDSTVTRGNSYTYTVMATNSVDDSAVSPDSNSVTTPDLPDQPDAPEATAAAAGTSVTVTWDAPNNNGAGITRYTLTRDPAFPNPVTVTGTPPDPRYVDNSVQRGNSYTYTVMATNSVGDSEVSPDSDSVTTPDRPDQPGQPTATVNSATSVTVNWNTPNNNRAPITSYTLTRTPAFTPNAAVTVTGSPPNPTYTDNTVTGDNSYTYTVAATNAAGTGAASPASASVTTPISAVNLTAEAGDGTSGSPFNTVTLNWSVSGGIVQTDWLLAVGGPVAPGAACNPGAPGAPSSGGSSPTTEMHTISGLDRGMDYCYLIRVLHTTPSGGPTDSNTVRVSIVAEPRVRLGEAAEVADTMLDLERAKFAVEWNASGNAAGITRLRLIYNQIAANANCPATGLDLAADAPTADPAAAPFLSASSGRYAPDTVLDISTNPKVCISMRFTDDEGNASFAENVATVTLTGRAAEGPSVESTQFQFRVGDATASPLAPVSIDNSPPSEVPPSTPATGEVADGETITVTLQGGTAGESDRGTTGYAETGAWAFEGGTFGADDTEIPDAVVTTAATSEASITVDGATVMIPGLGFDADGGGDVDTATFNAPVLTAMTDAGQTINLSPVVLRFTYTVTQTVPSGGTAPPPVVRPVYIRIRRDTADNAAAAAAADAADAAVLPRVLRGVTHSINNSIYQRIQQRQRADGKWK